MRRCNGLTVITSQRGAAEPSDRCKLVERRRSSHNECLDGYQSPPLVELLTRLPVPRLCRDRLGRNATRLSLGRLPPGRLAQHESLHEFRVSKAFALFTTQEKSPLEPDTRDGGKAP